MFWGMIAPEKPPFADREEHVLVGLRALVEVRALGALAAVGGSLGPGRLSVWQPEQRCGEQLGALVPRVVLGDVDALGAAGGEARAPRRQLKISD